MADPIPPPRPSLPSFRYSSSEVATFARIWAALDIISAGAAITHANLASAAAAAPAKSITRRSSFQSLATASNASSASPTKTPAPKKTPAPLAGVFASLPSLQYNLANLQHFQSKLCTRIYQLQLEAQNKTPANSADARRLELYDLVRLVPAQFRAIETDYQVIQMLQLITIIINCLEYSRPVPDKYLDYMSNVNGRVFGLDPAGYAMFGEALVVTIIEHLTERSPSPKPVMTLEEQVSFNLFVSELLNYLVLQNNDPTARVPHVEVTPAARNIPHHLHPAPVYTYDAGASDGLVNPRASYGEISVKSSRLSLYSPSDLDYDLSSCDEAAFSKYAPSVVSDVVSEETVTGHCAVADNDDEGDDSYNYLNSFDESPVSKKKKGRLSFFSRRRSMVARNDPSTKLVPSMSIRSRR